MHKRYIYIKSSYDVYGIYPFNIQSVEFVGMIVFLLFFLQYPQHNMRLYVFSPFHEITEGITK